MEGKSSRGGDAAVATAAPLRAPGDSTGRRGSNNRTTSSSGGAPRARPLRRGHARVMASHVAGSRWEWGAGGVGVVQGRWGMGGLSSRERRIFSFLTPSLTSRGGVDSLVEI